MVKIPIHSICSRGYRSKLMGNLPDKIPDFSPHHLALPQSNPLACLLLTADFSEQWWKEKGGNK